MSIELVNLGEDDQGFTNRQLLNVMMVVVQKNLDMNFSDSQWGMKVITDTKGRLIIFEIIFNTRNGCAF